MAGKKIYISSHIYVLYCKDDTSLQYAVTYNTLQVVVYPTNNCYLGILRLYCKDDTSLQYAVTYNTLQVVVYPTNNCYLGILRLRWGWGGGGGLHIIFQVFMLIVLV